MKTKNKVLSKKLLDSLLILTLIGIVAWVTNKILLLPHHFPSIAVLLDYLILILSVLSFIAVISWVIFWIYMMIVEIKEKKYLWAIATFLLSPIGLIFYLKEYRSKLKK